MTAGLTGLQRGLAAEGLYGEAIDGLFGPLSTAAVMAFAAGRKPDAAMVEFASPLSRDMRTAFINTVPRIAHFIATLCVESQGFTKDQENLRYTTPERLKAVFPRTVKSLARARELIEAGPVAIANAVYAMKNGNGAASTGDGYRFRGRTPAQLTGRDNYAALGKALGLPLESQPDLALDPVVSARICVRFWTSKNLNGFADANDAEGIRARWNGPAMLGLAEARRTAAAINRLGAQP